MVNKKQFQVKNSKKVLHKISKKWVVVSAMTLALLTGTNIAIHTNVHASTSATQATRQSSSVHSQATNLYNKIAKMPTQSQSNNVTKNNQLDSTNPVSTNDNQPANFNNNKNKALNNMNGTKAYTKQNDGTWAEKQQIVLEYTQNNKNNEKPLSIQPMTKNELQDFNNANIGVMPLYTSANPSNLMLYGVNSDAFKEVDYVQGASDQNGNDPSVVPYTTPSDNIAVDKSVTVRARAELIHNLAYGSPLGNNQFSPIASYNYASIHNNIWNGFYNPMLFGYLLTAPKNTDLRPLFTKYLYPQILDGYTLDNGNGTMFSVGNPNGTVILPNQLKFPNTYNIAPKGVATPTSTSGSSSTGTILLTYEKKAQSTITVNYVNGNTGQLIQKVGSDTQNIGTPFSATFYIKNIPQNYTYDGIDNNTNSYTVNNQTVNIKLLPKKVSTITVHYVDIKHDKVVHLATPVTNYSGMIFNIRPYQNNIPAGYQYVSVRNAIDKFNNHNHTIDILVKKIIPDANILVKIVTHKHGKILNSFMTTKKDDTLFNIENYIYYIPKGYHKVTIINNARSYINVPQTVTIVVARKNEKKPIIPASNSNYQPTSRANIIPSKASSTNSKPASKALPNINSHASNSSFIPSSASSSNVAPTESSSKASNKSNMVMPSGSKSQSTIPSKSPSSMSNKDLPKFSASSAKYINKVIPHKYNRPKAVSHKANSFEPKQTKASITTSAKLTNHSSKVTVKPMNKANANHSNKLAQTNQNNNFAAITSLLSAIIGLIILDSDYIRKHI